MKVKGIRFITITALMLALTIVFQMLRVILGLPNTIVTQLLVGTLVNLCLLVATAGAGIFSGIIISLAAPIVAFLQSSVPAFWVVPFIAIGNMAIVIIYGLLYEKSKILGFTFGAILKTAILWVGVAVVGISVFGLPEAAIPVVQLNFTWPQIITAMAGGILSLPVVAALKPMFKQS
ncbi:MAG: hypothetical protein R2876_04895 [Eubacteriales bacterium]